MNDYKKKPLLGLTFCIFFGQGNYSFVQEKSRRRAICGSDETSVLIMCSVILAPKNVQNSQKYYLNI